MMSEVFVPRGPENCKKERKSGGFYSINNTEQGRETWEIKDLGSKYRVQTWRDIEGWLRGWIYYVSCQAEHVQDRKVILVSVC